MVTQAPYLTKTVKANWLVHNLQMVFDYYEKAVPYYEDTNNDEIESFDFILDSGNSIKMEYHEMLTELFLSARIVGVYKSMLYPGTVDQVIGITIYGYNKDLTMGLEVVKFLLNGYDTFKTVGKKAILKQRKRFVQDTNRRRKHSGKKVHIKILLNIKELAKGFKCTKPQLLKENIKHREQLAKLVYMVEKLDLRTYHGAQKMSYKSARCHTSNRRLQLNRLV